MFKYLAGTLSVWFMKISDVLHFAFCLCLQKNEQSTNVPKGALCHDHFWAVLCIFSGIFLVNYLLMNSAANVFYTTGLLDFQDALSLPDQVGFFCSGHVYLFYKYNLHRANKSPY